MDRATGDRPAVIVDEETREARHRLARVQLVLGGAAAGVVLFGVVLVLVLKDRSLGGVPFWGLLGGVVVVFAAYFTTAIRTLRRFRPPKD